MFKRGKVKTYTYGSRIDTNKPLAVKSLPSDHWGDLEGAYPELKQLGKDKPWRNKNLTFTIQPPQPRDVDFLKIAARVNDDSHRSFPVFTETAKGRRLTGAVQLVNSREGRLLFIYRLAG